MGNVKKGRGLCKNCYCSIKGQPHRQTHRTKGGRNGLTSLGITWLTGDCQWLMDAPFVVTRSPTDAWTAQQLREATPYGHTPKYLIRDNDSKFGPCFARVAATSGIKILKTPYHAPRANAICERFLSPALHGQRLFSYIDSRNPKRHGTDSNDSDKPSRSV